MNKRLSFLIAALFPALMHCQTISRITLFAGSNKDIITIQADQGLLINFSPEGKIINWGIEDHLSRGINDGWGRLLNYMGREEYYTANDDAAYKGKIRYIGALQITYYGSYEEEVFKGKIKSIGSSHFDYYGAFEDESVRGKIKSAGPISLSYFSSFDNEACKGKIKSAGNTSISYYASYDDKAYRGKVKSIDNKMFTYYSSFERKEYYGAMKNYSPVEIINGIKYVIRN